MRIGGSMAPTTPVPPKPGCARFPGPPSSTCISLATPSCRRICSTPTTDPFGARCGACTRWRSTGSASASSVAIAAGAVGGYVTAGINNTRRGDGLARDIRRADCQVLLIDAEHRDSEAIRLGKAVVAAHRARARLVGANLGGADLRGANLVGADLRGAGATYGDGVPITRAPIIITGLTWSVLIFDTHMKIGCELHSLADWAAFNDRRIAQMDGKTALFFWLKNKDALLAMARANGREWPEVQEAAA